MSESNEGTGGPRLDVTAHSIIWRIRDAARYLGSIIPNVKSASRHRHDPSSPRAWREALIPQRMNRLVAAHSAIEDGFNYLISGHSRGEAHVTQVEDDLIGESRSGRARFREAKPETQKILHTSTYKGENAR